MAFPRPATYQLVETSLGRSLCSTWPTFLVSFLPLNHFPSKTPFASPAAHLFSLTAMAVLYTLSISLRSRLIAGLYFAIGVFLDLFLLGATTFAGVNYSTNAEAFQKAVKQVDCLVDHGMCAGLSGRRPLLSSSDIYAVQASTHCLCISCV